MNQRGYNAFHTAAEHRYSHVLETLAAHKQGQESHPIWDEHYLCQTTEDDNTYTALQIACRNQDKECVEVLLKYLLPAYQQQKYKEKIYLYQYEHTMRGEDGREVSTAVTFMKEHGIFEEVHKDILVRCLHMKYRSEQDCYCDKSFSMHSSKRLADCLIKKCITCLKPKIDPLDPNSPVERFTPLDATPFCPCPSVYIFDAIGHLLDWNVDISEYVLDIQLHSVVLKYYPNCSVRLLLRAFGMAGLSEFKLQFIVMAYSSRCDYDTVGLLYASLHADVFRQIFPFIESDTHIGSKEHDSLLFLQSCIAKTTCIDEAMSRTSDPVQYLTDAAKQPRTLQNCCVVCIRRCISSNVIRKAENLPLPLMLKNTVRLTNFQRRCSSSARCHGWRQEEDD